MATLDSTLYILTGPTAVGKTALSLEWAEKNNAEILYCDSTVIYQKMDIGTAKPTAVERQRIPHHGIDLVNFESVFSIQAYQKMALEAIQAIHARGKSVLITGGSGFYLKGFFSAVIDDIAVNDTVKITVARIFDNEGLAGLLNHLTHYSPEGLGKLDIHNPRRVIKALERVLMTGLSIPALEKKWAQTPSLFATYPKKTTLLTRDSDDLKKRIDQRVKAMITEGLIDEVNRLIPQGLLNHPVARQMIGYRETLDYLSGKIASKDALITAISHNTQRLVKKQHTFFRHQIPIDQVLTL